MDGRVAERPRHVASPAMPPRLPSTPPVIICQTGKSLLSLMSKLYLRVEVHKCRYFTRSDSDGNVQFSIAGCRPDMGKWAALVSSAHSARFPYPGDILQSRTVG